MSNRDNSYVVTQKQVESNHPYNDLKKIAERNLCEMSKVEFAKHMDRQDTLRDFRQDFCLPKMADIPGVDNSLVDSSSDCLYFAGNSIGLYPKKTREYVDMELSKWAKLGADGWEDHSTGLSWETCDEGLELDMARLVGGVPGEVAILNGLSVNLHLLLDAEVRSIEFPSFRFKVLQYLSKSGHIVLKTGEPVVQYAYQSHISLHGYDPNTSLVFVEPREGELTLRTDDILAMIEKEGDSVAVVCFGGVHYVTGQLLDIQAITQAAHDKGCYVGFDIAHGVGNVRFYLHDWNVDFACWCTYKYINGGTGCLGCIFLHKTHEQNDFPKLLGWWGQKGESRFTVDSTFNVTPGAQGYRITNPSPFLCASLKASLQIFNKTTMEEIRTKSKLMVAYMEYLILLRNNSSNGVSPTSVIRIITPSEPEQRGSQLALTFPDQDAAVIFEELKKRGVVCTIRNVSVSVIRIAVAPLYNSFEDVHRLMTYFDQAMEVTSTK